MKIKILIILIIIPLLSCSYNSKNQKLYFEVTKHSIITYDNRILIKITGEEHKIEVESISEVFIVSTYDSIAVYNKYIGGYEETESILVSNNDKWENWLIVRIYNEYNIKQINEKSN